MGRNAGIIETFIAGARVSAQPTYTPSYYRADGSIVPQKIKVPVAINGIKRKDTGVADVDFFSLIGWGKLADFLAKNCTKGRAIDCLATPGSYKGNYYHNGVMLVGNDGQPIQIDRVAFTISIGSLRLGEEAAEIVEAQIASAKRPRFWNLKNHQDSLTWKTILQTRNAVQYQHGATTFGYAKVQAKTNAPPAIANAVNTLPQAVANAFNNAPAQPSMISDAVFGAGGFGAVPVNNPPASAAVNNAFGTGGFGNMSTDDEIPF